MFSNCVYSGIMCVIDLCYARYGRVAIKRKEVKIMSSNIKRVLAKPQYLSANSDGGYQISAEVVNMPAGNELHITAERVVVSDAAHISPKYDRYMVAPRVIGDGHVPTFAQMVADACDWDYIDPPEFAQCKPGLSEQLALKWLQMHPDIVLDRFGVQEED